MSNQKTALERLLLDSASLSLVLTAILYSFGIFFSLGNIDGYGITEDIVSVDFRVTILLGFFSLFLTPFTSPVIWVLSLVGCIPLVLKRLKHQVPTFAIAAGIIFLFLFQVVACYDTGEISAQEEINDINRVFAGVVVEDFDTKKVTVEYKHPDSSTKTITGYTLDIPGNYFVIAQKSKLVALNKSDVVSIIYMTSQSK